MYGIKTHVSRSRDSLNHVYSIHDCGCPPGVEGGISSKSTCILSIDYSSSRVVNKSKHANSIYDCGRPPGVIGGISSKSTCIFPGRGQFTDRRRGHFTFSSDRIQTANSGSASRGCSVCNSRPISSSCFTSEYCALCVILCSAS